MISQLKMSARFVYCDNSYKGFLKNFGTNQRRYGFEGTEDTATTKSSHLVFIWFDSNLLVVYFVSVFSVGSSSLALSDVKVLTVLSCGHFHTLLFSFAYSSIQRLHELHGSLWGGHLSLFYFFIMQCFVRHLHVSIQDTWITSLSNYPLFSLPFSSCSLPHPIVSLFHLCPLFIHDFMDVLRLGATNEKCLDRIHSVRCSPVFALSSVVRPCRAYSSVVYLFSLFPSHT